MKRSHDLDSLGNSYLNSVQGFVFRVQGLGFRMCVCVCVCDMPALASSQTINLKPHGSCLQGTRHRCNSPKETRRLATEWTCCGVPELSNIANRILVFGIPCKQDSIVFGVRHGGPFF